MWVAPLSNKQVAGLPLITVFKLSSWLFSITTMVILERDNNWLLSTYPVGSLKEAEVVATNQNKVIPRYGHIKVAILRA